MKVYFIGAGPGAADLITVRGAKLLSQVPIVMYAGSLVPTGVLTHCRTDCKLVDSSALNLDDQEAIYRQAKACDQDVVRLHSGDPSIYGAISEQMRRLVKLEIEYEIVPGVSSFTASAARLGCTLTQPDVSQTVILTRMSGRASEVPAGESIESLAAHRATMCIFLSGNALPETIAQLKQSYPAETPVALIHKATWEDERTHRSTLGNLLAEVKTSDWQLTTMLIIGEAIDVEQASESRLYSPEYAHRFRKAVARRGK